MNYPRDICAYCGNQNNLSDDHIPPKNIFPKPRPNNLITVSACESCHSKTSKDDEYFRIKMCFRQDAGDHPSARKNWDACLRSLKRSEAKGMLTGFLSDLTDIPLYTPRGIYIGNRLAYHVNSNRIVKVVERIVRGLYFAHTGTPLSFKNHVLVTFEEELRNQPIDYIEELKRTILTPLAQKEPSTLGNNIFSYRFQITEENSFASVWLVVFYGCVSFLCFTDNE